MEASDYDHLFKLVLVGDSGVGKTSLLLRFMDDQFTTSYISTIGVDFRFKRIELDGQVVKLQIWDTAGQERFRTITSAYYRGADGIVMLYDVTSSESFDHVEEWLSEVNRYATPETEKLVVGNKADLEDQRQVSVESGQQLSQQLNIPHFETSAKSNTNVDEAFTLMAEKLLKSKKAEKEQRSVQLHLVGGNQSKNKLTCCQK